MRLSFRSLESPDNIRYEIYDDCTHFWDVMRRGGSARYLAYCIGFWETMGDGDVQHCPAAPVGFDRFPDFALSFGQWWLSGDLSAEDRRTIYFRLGGLVGAALSNRQRGDIEWIISNLKYDEHATKEIYYSLRDRDKKDRPRKSTDHAKSYDKRWHRVHQYNGAGTADAVYRCFAESEVVDWDQGLEAISKYELLRDEVVRLGGWEPKTTWEFWDVPIHPTERNHGPYHQALRVMRSCMAMYEARMEIMNQLENAKNWLIPA